MRVLVAALGLLVVAAPARAQSPAAAWNGLPDRFQIDAGYFHLDAETVLRSILTVEPPEVTHFNPLVPDEVARIVRGMLQKDVGKRTQRIAQVLGDFEDVIEHMGLHRGKDLLREYAQQPETVAAMWHKRHLSRHLDQGLYFENMGLGKIDDALREFRRVLYLDPKNAVANAHVRKLERERERLVKEGKGADPNATVVMAPGEAPPPAPATS